MFPLDHAGHVDHQGGGHVHHGAGRGDQVLQLDIQGLLIKDEEFYDNLRFLISRTKPKPEEPGALHNVEN